MLRRRGTLMPFVLPIALVLWGCAGESPSTPTVPETAPCEVVATVSSTAVSITVGESETLTASTSGTSSCGAISTDWSTSNDAVATVANGTITGVAEGSANVTFMAMSGNSTTSVIVAVTVTPAPVATVAVSPATASVALGSTIQLAAETRDASGNVLTGRTVEWMSSNTSVATVSASGLVSSVSLGDATITAMSEGQVGTATVTVTNAPVATVEVSPPAGTVEEDETIGLIARMLDANGGELTREVEWASGNDAVATVSATGVVQAHSPGVVTITATSEGQSGSATITVVQPPGLLHSWRFDEVGEAGISLGDATGGAAGQLVNLGSNDGVVSGGEVVLSGGAGSGTDYVDLGSGRVSHRANTTIEVWARPLGVQNWARIFDIGSSDNDYLLMSWSVGTDATTFRTEWRLGGNQPSQNTSSPFVIGEEAHIVLTVDYDAASGGTSTVTWYVNGVVLGSFQTDLKLKDLQDDDFWLGRSQYAGDETANAAYNEVRVYGRALSHSEIQSNYAKPPSRNLVSAVDGGWRSKGFEGVQGWYFTAFNDSGWDVPGAVSSDNMWHDSGSPVVIFRRVMDAGSTPSSMIMDIKVDDFYALTVNTPWTTSTDFFAADARWDQTETYDITSAWRSGDNVVTVFAADYGGARNAQIEIFKDGNEFYNTGPNGRPRWRAKALDIPTGFQTAGYDVSSWAVATTPASTPFDPLEAIWDPGGSDVVLFRREFVLDALPTSASLRISADNLQAAVFGGRSTVASASATWEDIQTIDVTSMLQVGTNVLWVLAADGGAGDGLLVDLRVVY